MVCFRFHDIPTQETDASSKIFCETEQYKYGFKYCFRYLIGVSWLILAFVNILAFVT